MFLVKGNFSLNEGQLPPLKGDNSEGTLSMSKNPSRTKSHFQPNLAQNIEIPPVSQKYHITTCNLKTFI